MCVYTLMSLWFLAEPNSCSQGCWKQKSSGVCVGAQVQRQVQRQVPRMHAGRQLWDQIEHLPPWGFTV